MNTEQQKIRIMILETFREIFRSTYIANTLEPDEIVNALERTTTNLLDAALLKLETNTGHSGIS
jgi:hypothetical protein